LGDRFGLLEQLQDDLSFEGGSVRLFHTPILPNLGPLTVQILGSTIPPRGTAKRDGRTADRRGE
jgi:hypothetical protein